MRATIAGARNDAKTVREQRRAEPGRPDFAVRV